MLRVALLHDIASSGNLQSTPPPSVHRKTYEIGASDIRGPTSYLDELQSLIRRLLGTLELLQPLILGHPPRLSQELRYPRPARKSRTKHCGARVAQSLRAVTPAAEFHPPALSIGHGVPVHDALAAHPGEERAMPAWGRGAYRVGVWRQTWVSCVQVLGSKCMRPQAPCARINTHSS